MTSCLSSRACGFDLEHMVKWPCTHTSRTTSNSSSPSSTLSESSNSPIGISTRKPRTPRKRPNQTYNEAAALLSMACPNIFSTKHLTKRTSNLPKFTKHHSEFFNEPSDLISSLPLIENSGFLLRQRIREKPCSLMEPKVHESAGEIEIESNCVPVELSEGCLDDFDTESILDEEIEQGINSIMGDLENEESNNNIASDFKTCYGYPIGLGFGVRNGVSALRNVDEGNWWSYPMVDVGNISPAAIAKGECFPVGKKKNKKKKKKVEELMNSEPEFHQGNLNPGDGNLIPGNEQGLVLKLDYDSVLNAWAGKGLPLPEEFSLSSSPGGGIHARAASIDLFSEKGGWGESSATRSTDKNHFKKIKHQLRNTCSDRRPRCKGRFVKKLNSTACDEKT